MISKIKQISHNENVIRYAKNSGWMMAEYSLRIVSAIFVSIYVARYLGPEQFGVLSYALAIVAIFAAISRLGMESILVRDLAKYPDQAKAYTSTAFGLMFGAALLAIALMSTLIYFFESDAQTQIYIWIIGIGLVFQTLLVVDYNFQAQVQAKYSSIAKSIALGISSAIKVYLVLSQSDLFYFAVAYAADSFIIGSVLLITHFIRKQACFFTGYSKPLVKPLLGSAWPMILSAIAAMLYMRIDQIMIKNMLDAHQLGLYAAATKIYEGWIIVPYVISISLLPAIVKLKSASQQSYEANMTKLFAIVFWSGIFVALITTFLGDWIIYWTFGEAFMQSQQVLIIVMWTAAFTALGSVTARYLTVESMEKKIAVRTFVGLVINMLLNLLLIPVYGIEGAAMATLITIIFANYLINYTDKQLLQLTGICNRAMTLQITKSR